MDKFIIHKIGICHGLAGSGYAFLILYRLTRREEWLDRAKAFAYLLMDAGFEVKPKLFKFLYVFLTQ